MPDNTRLPIAQSKNIGSSFTPLSSHATINQSINKSYCLYFQNRSRVRPLLSTQPSPRSLLARMSLLSAGSWSDMAGICQVRSLLHKTPEVGSALTLRESQSHVIRSHGLCELVPVAPDLSPSTLPHLSAVFPGLWARPHPKAFAFPVPATRCPACSTGLLHTPLLYLHLVFAQMLFSQYGLPRAPSLTLNAPTSDLLCLAFHPYLSPYHHLSIHFIS